MKIPVYIGRDNVETLALSMEDDKENAVDIGDFLVSVNRIVLATETVVVDSQATPAALVLDAAARTLACTLGQSFSDPGNYPAQLIFYSPGYPNGFVWIDRHGAADQRLTLVVADGV
ncbi:MAG TPA: hypothetical protein PKY50_06145 [Candidatus Competibacter sp.]|nr:hypothetical protein [Candidatus Competibacter sp.]